MRDILQDIREKIKPIISDQRTFTSLVLVLVAVTAFGLGRRSAAEPLAPAAAVETAAAPSSDMAASVAETAGLPETYYVASQNGSVYHLPYCAGAKRISEANKITFASKAEAEAAGYRPAANCPGL